MPCSCAGGPDGKYWQAMPSLRLTSLLMGCQPRERINSGTYSLANHGTMRLLLPLLLFYVASLSR